MARYLCFVLLLTTSLLCEVAAAPPAQTQPGLAVLDKNNSPISKLIDGDAIKLRVKLAAPAEQATPISFRLEPDNVPLAECGVAKSSDACQTDELYALGWAWSQSGQAQPSRTIRAGAFSTPIQIAPRPVVMAHGFGSSAEAWTEYTRANGYLAAMGVRGFAVGDGRVPGKLNLGSLADPKAQTGTIRSNAETLRDYIAEVKKATGAQMVDLMAHSMGSLVSRYYIDRVMPGRDVAQFIMLGPPNLGTDCANLPSSVGYYMPAVMEIRPSYVRGIFNPQITHRHGVPFTIVAGTPILEQVQSPCTAVPSDLAIAFDSATGIAAPFKQTGVWHIDLNSSAQVFQEVVKPLLQRPASEFRAEPDPAPPARPADDLQFTRVFAGHLAPGASATHTINLDQVTVASFALFDATRSLTVTVRGATGNVIALDPVRNGLIVVDDPETLVYLGYGFANPRPGPWQVTLQTTSKTPSSGADYAITAQLKGGAILRAHATPLLPRHDESVQLVARLELGGAVVPMRDVQARVRNPAGATQTIALTAAGDEWRAPWKPAAPGLYSVDVIANAVAPDGAVIERSAFLSIEVQPTPDQVQQSQTIFIGGIALGVVVLGIGIVLWRRRAQHRKY